MQKLKLLALPCTSTTSTTSPSPPRLSTTTSSTNSNSAPYFNFRRGTTLRTLLSRRFLLRGRNPTVDRTAELSLMKEGLLTSHKLQDLFVCSPPHLVADASSDHSLIINKSASTSDGVNGFGSLVGRVEEYPVRRQRFGSFGLRYRLLKGAWLPRLGAIPE